MAERITIHLNPLQKVKIRRKLGRVCDTIEVDSGDLINMIKYQGPEICIDFDEEQEKLVKKAFPDKNCDFALIDKKDLGGIMKYMPPP
jgi:hypothetical protein